MVVSGLRRKLIHFHKTSWPQDYEAAGHVTPKTANKINSGNQLITIFIFCDTCSGISDHGVVVPARLRMDHSALVKPLGKHPHRHAHKWVEAIKDQEFLKATKAFLSSGQSLRMIEKPMTIKSTPI